MSTAEGGGMGTPDDEVGGGSVPPPEPVPVSDAAGASLAAPSFDDDPATEIAHDMVKRGLLVAVPVVGLSWLVFGGPVAASIAYGVAIILGNFLLSAYLLAGAARISLGLVASAALGGYAVRLALVFAAVWLIRDTSWVRFVPLGITIIVTHLGLLFWELRFVSATMTHPGLKPKGSGGAGSGSRPAAGHRPDRYRHPGSLGN
jgi:hypothetical protein